MSSSDFDEDLRYQCQRSHTRIAVAFHLAKALRDLAGADPRPKDDVGEVAEAFQLLGELCDALDPWNEDDPILDRIRAGEFAAANSYLGISAGQITEASHVIAKSAHQAALSVAQLTLNAAWDARRLGHPTSYWNDVPKAKTMWASQVWGLLALKPVRTESLVTWMDQEIGIVKGTYQRPPDAELSESVGQPVVNQQPAPEHPKPHGMAGKNSRAEAHQAKVDQDPHDGDEAAAAIEFLDKLSKLSECERSYVLRTQLFLYAQTYYNLVEAVIAPGVSNVDTQLNSYYLDTIKAIRDLLTKPELQGFPGGFEPVVQSVFPSDDWDIGWDDYYAPRVTDFLSRAQAFLNTTALPSLKISYGRGR